MNNIEGSVREFLTEHADYLWMASLVSTAIYTAEGLKAAKERKFGNAVISTLGVIFSLISATNGLKFANEQKSQNQGESPIDITNRIKEAIARARAEGSIKPRSYFNV